MIYLSGKIRHDVTHPRLGFMMTPDRRDQPPTGGALAADSACFANPGAYSEVRYLCYLARLPAERVLFATAPDVLGDHAATVSRSLPALARIRDIGLKAAFVAQDGFNVATTPWDEFDALFVGGTTQFKFRGGRDAVMAAQARGKWCHMGRVNSFDRLRAAASIGCQSADGTFLAFGPDRRTPELLGWLDRLSAEPVLKLD